MSDDSAVSRSVLADQVKDRLLQDILAGRYPPESRIVETRVARELGTSQAPVREALRGLEALGVVEILPFRGARVRRPTTPELLEAYAVRSELEALGARLGVPRMTDADLADLEALGAEMQRAAATGDRHEVAVADASFHARLLALAGGKPVLVAGGITGAEEVRAALAAGAAGAVAGSRFLLTEESSAHPAYKQRLLGAERTLVTRLFGFAWPARHRVVPNRATEKWAPTGDEPAWVAALQRATVILQKLPMSKGPTRLVPLQRLWLPLYTPVSPQRWMDERICDVAPLYAGEGVRRIRRILPAAEAVAELARGL